MPSSRPKMSKTGSKMSKTRSKLKHSSDSGISSSLPPMPPKYRQYPPMTVIPEKEKRNDSPVFTNIMERLKEVPTRIKEAPPKKFGKFGAVLAVGGAAFGWIIFPYVLYRSLTGVMNLEPGGEVYEKWKVVPFALDFNMYIFNVTNPDEVMNGAKPILQQVGPYRYEEWKTKEGIVDDPANDEMTYSNVNTFYFKKQETLPLTGDELVTIPHLPMMVSNAGTKITKYDCRVCD
uniref:Sensory neuron membrane protein 1-2 n=1 Tax=Cyrtorhinus lividipennis TaxID=1032904 RepID=A0A346TI34_9HEMI|nr:sensory neuron membrane protein 1-2 [Cyrtorhinus lividipennis]